MKILSVNASASKDNSVTRILSQRLVRGMVEHHGASVIARDTLDLPLLNHELLTAVRGEPNSSQSEMPVTIADELIQELKDADAIVIGAPMYNFAIPAALKAWIDLVAQPKKTFRYTESGPEGLLRDKPVYVVVATGGVRLESPADFVTPYLRAFFGFLGLNEVRVIAAEGMAKDRDAGIAKANATIDDVIKGR